MNQTTKQNASRGSLLRWWTRCRSRRMVSFALAASIALTPAIGAAQAQPSPPAAEAASAPPVPEAPPAPPPVAGEVMPAPPVTTTLSPPPPPAPSPAPVAAPAAAMAPPPPPPWGPDPRNVAFGAWLRLGGRIQNPQSRNQLNDFWMDEVYVILSANGRITPWFKWQFNLNADNPATQPNGAPPLTYASVGIQDLIFKFEPHPMFNVWFGRMLVPGDRSNLSGPSFINYFLYPGFLRVRNVPPPIGLKTGRNGRDQGATFWGVAAGGSFKYYLGAYNLDGQTHTINPLVTARLVVNLLDPEPAYYNQSAYHGARDIVAIAAGLQYQKQGSFKVIAPAPPGGTPTLDQGDLHLFEADLLVDKKLGAAGVGTLEGAAYF